MYKIIPDPRQKFSDPRRIFKDPRTVDILKIGICLGVVNFNMNTDLLW